MSKAKNSKRILKVTVRRMVDDSPDTSYLEQKGFEERLERYGAGFFCFVGVHAEAQVQVSDVVQKITSDGQRAGGFLWRALSY